MGDLELRLDSLDWLKSGSTFKIRRIGWNKKKALADYFPMANCLTIKIGV